MERNFDNFKGKVVEDSSGNLYFVNGLIRISKTKENRILCRTSNQMVVYTSLDNKRKVFTVPADYFLNMSSTSKKYRFSLSTKVVAPLDLPILQDDQTVPTFSSASIPIPRKWVIISIIIIVLLAFIANILLPIYF